MKKSIKVLLWVSLLLFVASLSTCYFGVNYAISQIPPEVRAKMGDTDWVGVEWITRGLFLLLASLLSLLIAFALIFVRKWRMKNLPK
jgi:hypothetical protein